MSKNNQPTILVVNANSSCSVTEGLQKDLVAPTSLLNVDIQYTQIDAAPAAIESSDDVKIAHELTTNFVMSSSADAFVVACFCDPGVTALRSRGFKNVFGIGESAMHMAASFGGKFGMLSISDLSVERHRSQLSRTGLEGMLAADLPLYMGVLELEHMSARPQIEKISRMLVDDHDACSIVLGCAGLGSHRSWLQDLLGVPVIDPCWAGVSTALGALGCR